MKLIPSLFAGSKPPLRPAAPAPFTQPDERDRQALFANLKWSTCYSVIEYNARLWSKFAAEWETWLRSQDDPSEGRITTFKYILDDQINYEEGLKRLRKGDRSVWTPRASYGYLDKLNTGLVDRRMEWYASPEYYEQNFGIPASMINAYFKAHNAAMAVAGWSGGYSGDRFWEVRAALDLMPKPHELPEPRWEVSFAPGGRAPKDGMYEQVNRDGHLVGGMAYFIKSMKSSENEWVEYGPDAGPERSDAFLWRLLWEDTRYKDGTIPEEEKFYPTPEQIIALAIPTTTPSVEVLNLRCPAGEACPKTGYWITPAKADARRHFKQGDVMPDLGSNYGATIWQWDADQG
ncbi:MAG: hypothetical protein H6R19_2944 [Proteobacteria bacterium]|nr:hypothetical protein [Pseudomonadota bacterium]